MKLRIGWDLDKTLDPRDGVGHYCYQLLSALMAVDRENEYVLYQPHGRASEIDLERAFTTVPDNFRLAPLGLRNPSIDDVDLVHSTAWLQPIAFEGPVLFTCYDLTFLSHAECHTLENRLACLTGTLRAHLGGAHFVAISQATAKELTARLSVPRERISVIYPGVASRFVPLNLVSPIQSPTDRFGLPAEFILAVGTLEPRKNLSRLIDAHRRLPPELRRRCPLVIAGGGGWKQEGLLREGEGEGSIEGVRWLGSVTDDDLVLLYNRATLFAYPSLAEGFGLPIAEAMACGTPVLTSNRSSMSEVAGDAAVTVDPTDIEAISLGMGRLLRDRDLRETLKTAGLSRAKGFSWEQAAVEILECYQALAGSRES